MTLEWLIPLKTFAIALICVDGLATGNALSYTSEQGWGWAVAAILSGAIVFMILQVSWEWLDELIQEAENEPA